MGREKSYRLHQKKVKVEKKKYILKHIYFYEEESLNPRVLGQLNKGKVHCSCPMCSTKRALEGPKPKEADKWSNMQKEIDKHTK